MIYDVRTYNLRPHTVPEAEQRLGKSLLDSTRNLAASFHTEIGPLNQIVQIWKFDELADRERVPAACGIDDLVIDERSDLFAPFAISPELTPRKVGPFFEMRTYTYASGDLPKMITAWEAALPGRLEWGPIVGVWHSQVEGANTLLHIWPYESLDARWQLRKKVRETGLWPPLAFARNHGLPEYKLLAMENKIVVPATFSPLQ